MSHLLQVLAQHWHLSASEYWQLRLLCALTLGPLLGVVCLILFSKRDDAGGVKRRMPTLRRPLQPTIR